MIRLWAVTAAVACLLVSPAYGDHCVQRQRVFHRQAVVHHGHVQQVIQPVYATTYYQVAPHLQAEAVAVRAAEIAREQARTDLLAELKKLGLLKSTPDGGGDLPVGPPPDGGSAVDAAAQKLLVMRCATCHTGANAMKGLDISDIKKLTELQVSRIGVKVHRGSMPENAAGEPAPLPDDEANFIYAWSDNDAAEADIPAVAR